MTFGVLLTVMGWSLLGCSGGADDSTPVPTPEMVEPDALVVCAQVPYKPFIYEEDGDLTGFELDLLRRMADGLGLAVDVRPTPFAALDSGAVLDSERCDVAAGALAVTDERRERMAFVDPHYDVQLSLLVPSASDIGGLADLAGRRLAVPEGTVADSFARQQVPAGTEVDGFGSDQEMFRALRQGRVDGILQDQTVNLAHVGARRFAVVETHPTGEQYAFAVRADAVGLRRSLDRQLRILRQDGSYAELYDSYFAVE